MESSERTLEDAQRHMEEKRDVGHAVAARYDRRRGRLVVDLNTGVEFAIPTERIEGLAGAVPGDLSDIEISPAGLGLHWPKLDADVYLPELLKGVFGSRRWMAAQMGSEGGRSRSPAKTAAARENGRKGGRPRKTAAAG